MGGFKPVCKIDMFWGCETDTTQSIFDCNCSADDMLNDLEHNPDSTTQMIWNVSKSPAGQQAAKGVRNAADLTLQAGD